MSPLKSWTALTQPIVTGLTVSKWEGLGRMLILIFLPLGLTFSVVQPRWYLTSPELPHSASSKVLSPISWNSAKIYSGFLLKTHAKVLRRPLWGIPKIRDSIPLSQAWSTRAPKPEMKESQPSIPKRLEVENLFFKKRLNYSFLNSLSRVFLRSSTVKVLKPISSILFYNQSFSEGFSMW